MVDRLGVVCDLGARVCCLVCVGFDRRDGRRPVGVVGFFISSANNELIGGFAFAHFDGFVQLNGPVMGY